MNGTKEQNKGGIVDGSRFVLEDTDAGMHRADESSQPIMSSQPSPDAFMPRPTRPFPISIRDENPKRGNWWNKIEFIFACIIVCSSAFNFMRFPYLVFSHGGGVFLILYVLCMIFIMFPYVVLEMALGQFSSSGIISVWNLSPLFKGFGIVATLYLALHNVVTNVYSAYNLLYAFVTIKYSISSEVLPWLSCSQAWNTLNCYDKSHQVVPTVNTSMSIVEDFRDYRSPFSPAEEYFSYTFGNAQLDDLTNIGALQPSLVFALLATWGFVLALTCMGAKWTGKVAYFLLPVIVILLFALLMRGATLPGALDGLIFYLHIDRRALLSADTWNLALREAFYVGFLGFGVFSSLASYNKFHNNFCLDAVFVMTANIVINIMMLLIVATFAGFYSFSAATNIGGFANGGTELFFSVIPTIMAELPSPNAWTCVFFLLGFLLFTGSSIYVVQALLTTLLDVFHLPHSFIFLLPTSGIICVLSFLVSLPMVTQAGFGVVGILDQFTLPWAPAVVFIVLPLVSVWVYGTIPKWDIMRLPREIQKMVGFFPLPIQFIFLMFWAGIVPLAMAISLVYSFTRVSLGFFTPYWMDYIMLALGIVPLLLIPIAVGLFQLCKRRRGYTYFTQLFWRTAASTEDWGPPVEHHRQQVGYASPSDGNANQMNSEIHCNPATAPLITAQDPTPAVYPLAWPYSPSPPSYEYHPGPTSPGSGKSLSPAPSTVGSGLPSVYPSPLVRDGPPASPATVSATDTVDSNRLYPSANVDCPTGAETDLGLSEPEDSAFINISSHETTL